MFQGAFFIMKQFFHERIRNKRKILQYQPFSYKTFLLRLRRLPNEKSAQMDISFPWCISPVKVRFWVMVSFAWIDLFFLKISGSVSDVKTMCVGHWLAYKYAVHVGQLWQIWKITSMRPLSVAWNLQMKGNKLSSAQNS